MSAVLSERFRRALNRLLSRKSAPPAQTPSAPAQDKTWQPGDCAECKVGGHWFVLGKPGLHLVGGPQKGQVFVVTAVAICTVPNCGDCIFLRLRGLPGEWDATCFRKLQPIADKAEAADSTFLQDLRHRLSRQPEKV